MLRPPWISKSRKPAGSPLAAPANKGVSFGTFAHTSPVYVQFAQLPMNARPDDVDFFLQWLDGYRKVVIEFAQANRNPEEEYRDLLARIDDAARVYRALATSPQRWTTSSLSRVSLRDTTMGEGQGVRAKCDRRAKLC